MKVQPIVELFLKNLQDKLKIRTYISYKHMLDLYILPEFMNDEIESFNEVSLNDFVRRLHLTDLYYSTLKLIRVVFNSFLKFVFNAGYLKKDLKLTLYINEQEQKHTKHLSLKEVEILESYILSKKKHYHYGILLSLCLGLRIGELLSLKWEDVNMAEQIICINKTKFDYVKDKILVHITTPQTKNGMRIVPITNQTKNILKELKELQPQSDFVVANRLGQQVYVRAYQKSFELLLRKLKLERHTFRSLRYTFAIRCYRGGMDIKMLRELLGYTNPTTILNVYEYSDIDMKRDVLTHIEKKIESIC